MRAISSLVGDPLRYLPHTFVLAGVLCLAPLNAADFSSASKVLKTSCLPCHGASAKAGGLSLESQEDIMRGGKSGAAIVPGRPVDSLLLTMVASGKMPMGGKKLSEADQITLRTWIEQETSKPPIEERDVQAVVSAKCWVCHGRTEKKAGLDLRSRESILRGGKSGPAIAVGDPGASLLVKRIAAQQMPPPALQEQFSVRGLTDSELDILKRWIAAGAPANTEVAIEVNPQNDPAVPAKDRNFWAFQKPVRPEVPALKNPPRNSIDAFLLEALEKRGAAFAPEAPANVLLRRAYFDLTGLPPTPEDIARFEQDSSADRFEKLISRLLESPAYGERWARHWMDAVGYSDSEGGNGADQLRRTSWRYRDYLIRAFNANTPYDQFLTEQLAGDELYDYRSVSDLTPRQIDLLAATGFWRMGPDGTNSTEQNFIPERMDVIAGQLEILGSSVMGLSVGCARCHDHKYDPIPTRDYYRMVAVLTPAFDPYHWLPGGFPCIGVGAKCDENSSRVIIAKATPEFREISARNTAIDARLKEFQKALADMARPYRDRYFAQHKLKDAAYFVLEAAYPEFKTEKAGLDAQIRKERAQRKEPPLIRALFDMGPEPPPTRILFRGDVSSPGPLVGPGVLSAVTAEIADYKVEPVAHSSGRRLGLAKWLTQPGHPLTARVMVNRIWQHHFGTGLVNTPGNFGKMGSPPGNQKLLDWLATEFVRSGWDIKAMHRLIMASTAYRQRTGGPSGDVRRIDAESIRDAILKISGRLDSKQFGPAAEIQVTADGEVISKSRRRSIYLTQRRTQPVSMLEAFDQPFMNPNCVERGHSVVSSQALHLLNGEFGKENSRYMAGRIIDAVGTDETAQVERAYLLAYARKASATEVKDTLAAMASLRQGWKKQLQADEPAEPIESRASWSALATVCHTLMNSAEFLYLD